MIHDIGGYVYPSAEGSLAATARDPVRSRGALSETEALSQTEKTAIAAAVSEATWARGMAV